VAVLEFSPLYGRNYLLAAAKSANDCASAMSIGVKLVLKMAVSICHSLNKETSF